MVLRLTSFVGAFIFSSVAIAWQPTKPIEITVPFPPGSGNDMVIRPLAAVVEKNTGVKFVITNRPGAGGTVGTAYLATKPNDGHFIGVLSIGGTAAMDYTWLAKSNNQAYTVNSFTYATALAQSPLVVIANKNDPISTPEQLINVLINDKNASISHSGAAGQLSQETFLFYADVLKKNPKLVRVEHKGPTETMADVMGGHVRFGSLPLSVAYTNYKAGNIKIIAVVQQNKSQDAEINTFASVNRNIDVTLVWGIALPKDTPVEVLNWYAKVFKEAQNDPTVKEIFAKNRYSPVPGLQTPESFTAYVMSEQKKHARIIDIIINSQKAVAK